MEEKTAAKKTTAKKTTAKKTAAKKAPAKKAAETLAAQAVNNPPDQTADPDFGDFTPIRTASEPAKKAPAKKASKPAAAKVATPTDDRTEDAKKAVAKKATKATTTKATATKATTTKTTTTKATSTKATATKKAATKATVDDSFGDFTPVETTQQKAAKKVTAKKATAKATTPAAKETTPAATTPDDQFGDFTPVKQEAPKKGKPRLPGEKGEEPATIKYTKEQVDKINAEIEANLKKLPKEIDGIPVVTDPKEQAEYAAKRIPHYRPVFEEPNPEAKKAGVKPRWTGGTVLTRYISPDILSREAIDGRFVVRQAGNVYEIVDSAGQKVLARAANEGEAEKIRKMLVGKLQESWDKMDDLNKEIAGRTTNYNKQYIVFKIGEKAYNVGISDGKLQLNLPKGWLDPKKNNNLNLEKVREFTAKHIEPERVEKFETALKEAVQQAIDDEAKLRKEIEPLVSARTRALDDVVDQIFYGKLKPPTEYTVVQRGSKWVVKDDSGKTVGTFESRYKANLEVDRLEKAQKQQISGSTIKPARPIKLKEDPVPGPPGTGERLTPQVANQIGSRNFLSLFDDTSTIPASMRRLPPGAEGDAAEEFLKSLTGRVGLDKQNYEAVRAIAMDPKQRAKLGMQADEIEYLIKTPYEKAVQHRQIYKNLTRYHPELVPKHGFKQFLMEYTSFPTGETMKDAESILARQALSTADTVDDAQRLQVFRAINQQVESGTNIDEVFVKMAPPVEEAEKKAKVKLAKQASAPTPAATPTAATPPAAAPAATPTPTPIPTPTPTATTPTVSTPTVSTPTATTPTPPAQPMQQRLPFYTKSGKPSRSKLATQAVPFTPPVEPVPVSQPAAAQTPGQLSFWPTVTQSGAVVQPADAALASQVPNPPSGPGVLPGAFPGAFSPPSGSPPSGVFPGTFFPPSSGPSSPGVTPTPIPNAKKASGLSSLLKKVLAPSTRPGWQGKAITAAKSLGALLAAQYALELALSGYDKFIGRKIDSWVEKRDKPGFDLADVVEFFNNAVTTAPRTAMTGGMLGMLGGPKGAAIGAAIGSGVGLISSGIRAGSARKPSYESQVQAQFDSALQNGIISQEEHQKALQLWKFSESLPSPMKEQVQGALLQGIVERASNVFGPEPQQQGFDMETYRQLLADRASRIHQTSLAMQALSQEMVNNYVNRMRDTREAALQYALASADPAYADYIRQTNDRARIDSERLLNTLGPAALGMIYTNYLDRMATLPTPEEELARQLVNPNNYGLVPVSYTDPTTGVQYARPSSSTNTNLLSQLGL